MMNPELKSKWLEALRSGNYKQAHGKLKTDKGYCCLGVLCEVAGLQGEVSRYYSSPDRTIYMFGTHSEVSFFPEELRSIACISEKNRRVLMEMNDNDRKSFAEIADWIQRNL